VEAVVVVGGDMVEGGETVVVVGQRPHDSLQSFLIEARVLQC
jgi:hypothetical protein